MQFSHFYNYNAPTMLTKGRHPQKMKVLIRALPESGGGGLPLPEFFGPFFHQVIVPKKVIFYPKLTIFVGFSVIFVIIIIKITKILIKIIMATIIIIISIFFHHTRKTSFLSAGKKGPRCPNWGVGGVQLIRAMPELKPLFSVDVFPQLTSCLSKVVAMSGKVSGVGIAEEKLTCMTTASKWRLKGDGEFAQAFIYQRPVPCIFQYSSMQSMQEQ